MMRTEMVPETLLFFLFRSSTTRRGSQRQKVVFFNSPAVRVFDLQKTHKNVKDNKSIFWFLEFFKANEGENCASLGHRSGSIVSSSLPRLSKINQPALYQYTRLHIPEEGILLYLRPIFIDCSSPQKFDKLYTYIISKMLAVKYGKQNYRRDPIKT